MSKVHCLLTAIAGTLLLTGCADEEQAAQEAEALKERTAASIAEDPATEPPVADIPPPGNISEPPTDARRLDSGIAYVVQHDSPGETHPDADDIVTVHYTGWTTDGQMFDSSIARGEPATFPLNRLIKGWQQGVPLMTVGDEFRFWIPADLAYGNSTRPGAPQGTLVFDIKLLGVEQVGETQTASPDETASPGSETEG
ncbi:MAG TPA: FKBP-type peptidyl-prolyl cis-trans isomerase [Gammaproteobacteria bacterium]